MLPEEAYFSVQETLTSPDHADVQRRAKKEGRRDVRQVRLQRGRHHRRLAQPPHAPQLVEEYQIGGDGFLERKQRNRLVNGNGADSVRLFRELGDAVAELFFRVHVELRVD